MTFSELYEKVDSKFSEWGQKGIALVGESPTAWIFKSHSIPGNILSGQSVIVDKSSGNIHFMNVGNPEDRKIENMAKVIDSKTVQKMLDIV